ncbi:MAG: polyprenyl synthetase family protein [Deltaproteobacteria bacterium]|jgi:octaprenyl-diphosphate synthase|nr:polyprenyl synthetase family protein [Deltaproteobacteria bacterium]
MQIQDVFRLYAEDLKQVKAYMESSLRSEVRLIPEIIRHIIDSGGKRFRPLLLLAASDLCGYSGDRRYPLATVIEFIHTATLLHDDVIDEADVRRGKASANRVWGNAASVLVGDFLYSKSFRLLTEYGNLDIIRLLSTTSNIMSEGEVLQLLKRGDVSITEADYLSIIDKKTAVLISAACALGGHLGGVDPGMIEALARYGLGVGAAFQMTDDTLDYIAREDEFGKAIGKDLEEGKLTLPLIRTMAQGSKEEKTRMQTLLRKTARTPEDIGEIRALIGRYDGISYTLDKAAALIAEARERLAVFPDTPQKTVLLTIADHIVERKI